MIKETESKTLSSHIFLSTLVILGILGNHFNVTLFFGVDFLFGSIFSFLILAIYGFRAALISTILISSYTYFLWNHPYAALALILEIIFVGIVWRKTRYNLTIAAGSYWFLVGTPFVLLCYAVFLHMNWQMSLLAAVKQNINGVFNAIIASLIISFAPTRLLPGVRVRSKSIFQTIFNIVVAAALIPSFTILIYDSQKVITQVESSVRSQLAAIRTEIAQSTVRWRRHHLGATQLLAKMVSDAGVHNYKANYGFMSKILAMSPAFENILIADGKGKIVSYYPATEGKLLIGKDFSDRLSFKTLKSNTVDLFVSPVFQGSLNLHKPMITISSSVLHDNKFEGVVSLAINLENMGEILKSNITEKNYIATIVDRNNNVIVSTDPKLTALTPYPGRNDKNIETLDEDHFRRWPKEDSLAPMSRWSHSSLGIGTPIAADFSWILYVEIPLHTQQSLVFNEYIRLMSFLLFFALVILIVTYVLALKISNPLSKLSEQASVLPEKLSSGQKTLPLESPFTEIINLISSFNSMAVELGNRFKDLQESTSKLRQANVLKDEFLATLSHELRTPLNIIVGHAELLKNPKNSAEDNDFSIDAIERATKSQTQLINDLLDVSAITTGKIRFMPTPISISEIVKSLVENLKFSASSKGVKITSNVPHSPAIFIGDEVRMQQIIWNLLSNSIKFTPKGGSINIDVLDEEDQYIIRVQDTGKGIDPHFLPYVFDRFRQEDGSSTRKYGGLGLGLSIVYHLVDMHGGTISVNSPGIDLGSTFEIRFPKNL